MWKNAEVIIKHAGQEEGHLAQAMACGTALTASQVCKDTPLQCLELLQERAERLKNRAKHEAEKEEKDNISAWAEKMLTTGGAKALHNWAKHDVRCMEDVLEFKGELAVTEPELLEVRAKKWEKIWSMGKQED
eukprot:7749402-Lingulodinium_polyedra.AAC.1